MGLNIRRKKFVDYYVETGNGAEAARKAGYSVKAARTIASELLAIPDVAEAVRARAEAMDAERIARPSEVLKYLTAVLRGEENDQIPVTRDKGEQTLVPKTVDAKDRLKAAELLGKRYLLFSDRLNVDGAMNVVFEGESGLED